MKMNWISFSLQARRRTREPLKDNGKVDCPSRGEIVEPGAFKRAIRGIGIAWDTIIYRFIRVTGWMT